MKKIFCYLSLFILLSAFQCDDDIPARAYYFTNNSDYDITLTFYNVNIGKKTITEVLTLDSLEQASGYLAINTSSSLYDINPLEEYNPLYIAAAFNDADSVSIVFDNHKYLSYTLYKENDDYFSEPVDRNVFNDQNYNNDDTKGYYRNENYNYIITNDDYENALDCNGNCN